jgi:starch synthase
MQIYFIDNEDYFQRKSVLHDKQNKFFDDNDERSIFFSRGVLETVKKLGWGPDLVHCHGWFAGLVPLYVKKAYKDNPLFSDTKVVCSIYNDPFEGELNSGFAKKIMLEGITDGDLTHYQKPTYVNLHKAAIDFSDALILGDQDINPEIMEYLEKSGKPYLEFKDEESYIDAYSEFYDKILVEEEVAS